MQRLTIDWTRFGFQVEKCYSKGLLERDYEKGFTFFIWRVSVKKGRFTYHYSVRETDKNGDISQTPTHYLISEERESEDVWDNDPSNHRLYKIRTYKRAKEVLDSYAKPEMNHG